MKKSQPEKKPSLGKSGKVVPLKVAFAKKPRRKPADRWSPQVMSLGFTVVPNLLLRGQNRLGLSAEEFNVVLHLAQMWWDAGDPPHPSKALLARRMGIKERQVQRHLASLEKKKLIQRVARHKGPKNQTSNAYLLTGLVQQMVALVPEFRKEQEQKRIREKKVETATA